MAARVNDLSQVLLKNYLLSLVSWFKPKSQRILNVCCSKIYSLISQKVILLKSLTVLANIFDPWNKEVHIDIASGMSPSTAV
jgi:hypothetical protein